VSDFLLSIFFCLINSFWFAASFAPICIYFAKKFNIVDVPDGRIKIHKQPTPYLGGLVVYFGLMVGSFIFLPNISTFTLMLFALFGLVLLLGLLDDLIFLHQGIKFLGIAVLSFFFLLTINHFIGLGDHFWIKFIIYWVWIMSITNAFNLIDIMDGLSSTSVFFPAAFFLFVAIYQGNYLATILIASFLGGILGFFIFNAPPAKIYMGDSGSLLLGCFISVVPLLLNWESFGLTGYSLPIIVLAIPCLEVFALIIIRSYKKIPFYLGSPDHFAIYLQKSGWSKWGVLGLVSILSLVEIFACLSYVIFNFNFFGLVVAGVWFLIAWIFLIFIL